MLLLPGTLFSTATGKVKCTFRMFLRPLAHGWKIFFLDNRDRALSVRNIRFKVAFFFLLVMCLLLDLLLLYNFSILASIAATARHRVRLQHSFPLSVTVPMFLRVVYMATSESSRPLSVVASTRISQQCLLRIIARALRFSRLVSHSAQQLLSFGIATSL